MVGGQRRWVDRGDEWTDVVGGQRWWVDRGGGWTEVVGGQRRWVDRGDEWTEVVGGACRHARWNLDRSFPPLRCNVHLIIGEVLVIEGNSTVIV